jgi:hypothetical protein
MPRQTVEVSYSIQARHNPPALSVMASVGVDGGWPETADIRCTAPDENAFAGPWLKGRGAVRFGELIQELQATLQERKQVIALAREGRPGPYVFGKAVWRTVDSLGGLEQF